MKRGGTDGLSTLGAGSPREDASRTDDTVKEGRGRVAGPRFAALATQRRDPRRYQVLGEHGRGALGRVSRAHDRELGRDVAIKELLSRGRVQEVRFLREALITARLEHPGIVPVHEAGRWPDGTPFYAMKLVSGRPLRDLILERPVEERIGLLHHVIAVADAIAYAHGCNIIHRDLKPANVIVGEFGETVVIDWGLAKDLSSSDEPAVGGGGPLLGSSDGELTVEGSVLGTPAYMAPEAKRGEPVDQRADVFAIGTMLWELCAARRVPPEDVRVRRRMLRRAGIDRDLITILDKALAADPAQRYGDAGALAADLKAFKSGARIAARQYSLFALLAHWTRRHRALALSAVAAVAVAVIASLLYVRSVTAQRDRADAQQELARQAEGLSEAALDELTLKHAQLLLATDPSAAVDALVGYRGADRARADQIGAEAVGRGVALVRGTPHTRHVFWTEGTSAGAVLSLSIDGTIARTARDGRSTVITRGVSGSGVVAYAASRRLLAYACDPSDVCLFDAARIARLPTPALLRGVNVNNFALSPDGNRLALLSREGELRVLEIADPARPVPRLTRSIPGGFAVAFVDGEVVAVATSSQVVLIRATGEAEAFPIADASAWAASPTTHALAVGTPGGRAFLVAPGAAPAPAGVELCRGPVVALAFLHARHSVAYACRTGAVGTWEPARGAVTPRAQLEGRADLLAADPTGNYLVAAGGNGAVTVIDLRTELATIYRGHGQRLTSLEAPTPERPFLISADLSGAVRAWPLPAQLARVAMTSSARFYTAIVGRRSDIVVATTWDSVLTVLDASAGVRTVAPHVPENFVLEQSASGATVVAYGLTDLVEVWSAPAMVRTRVIETGQGSVTQLGFVEGSEDFITSGSDGRLLHWTPAGQAGLLARLDQPIDRFTPIDVAGGFVVSTVDGALWRVAGGRADPLRPGGPRASRLLMVPAQHRVYAGDASGDVVAIDTRSWQQEVVLRGAGAVQDMISTDDGRVIAIATSDGALHVGTRDALADPRRVAWHTWPGRARQIALTADGLLVASSADGTIWLHAPLHGRWLGVPTGAADLGRIAVAGDGDVAVVPDVEGRVIRIDLAAARERLHLPAHPDRP